MCFCDVRQNGGSAWIGGEELIIPGPDVGATTIMVEDLDPFGEAVWYHAAAESQWSFLINQKHARFVEKKCGDATSEEKDFELILETSAEKKKKWEVRASVKPKVEVEAPPLTAGVEAELGGTYSESWTQAATHLKIRGTIEGVPV